MQYLYCFNKNVNHAVLLHLAVITFSCINIIFLYDFLVAASCVVYLVPLRNEHNCSYWSNQIGNKSNSNRKALVPEALKLNSISMRELCDWQFGFIFVCSMTCTHLTQALFFENDLRPHMYSCSKSLRCLSICLWKYLMNADQSLDK